MTPADAERISREVATVGGRADRDLVAKSNWEGMTRTEIISEWGDPREWVGLNPKRKGDS